MKKRLGRPKGSKNKKDKMQCNRCKEEKSISQFYKSNSPLFNGYAPICKKCVKKYVDIEDMETVYDMLRQLDIKFDIRYWNAAYEKGGNVFGNYLRMANGLRQLKNYRWEDSVFEKEEKEEDLYINNNEIKEDNNDTTYQNEEFFDPRNYKPTVSDFDTWGYGYKPEEYYYFEKKYQQLKNNYPERTTLHREALLTYIRYKVKEELATARGEVKEAKEWGNLARNAAEAAKINPSQLSRADLSDGLDSFSQLTRSVEQAVDIIEILPNYKERPKDKVDVTLWCYINYVRDLNGLPPAEYSDIYKFYEERRKQYESMILDEVDYGEL